MATKGIGRLIQVGLAKESTRGTGESSATFWIPWADVEPLDDQHELVQDEATIGVIEDTQGAERTRRWAEGSLQAPIGDAHFGLILLAAFGTITTTTDDPESGVNTHSATVAQSSQHQSVSLFVDDPMADDTGEGDGTRHALGVLTSLEIAYEQGQFVRYTANWMTKRGTALATTPSTTSENRFLPQHLTFSTAASGQDNLPGTTINIRSLTLTIEKNVEGDWSLGDDEPTDFLNTQFAITGELEAVWQNEDDFKDDFVANTEKSVRIVLENTGVTIGNSSSPKLVVDLPAVTFQELSRNVTLNEIVTQTLTFKAHYNTTDSKMAEVGLINTTASY